MIGAVEGLCALQEYQGFGKKPTWCAKPSELGAQSER